MKNSTDAIIWSVNNAKAKECHGRYLMMRFLLGDDFHNNIFLATIRDHTLIHDFHYLIFEGKEMIIAATLTMKKYKNKLEEIIDKKCYAVDEIKNARESSQRNR